VHKALSRWLIHAPFLILFAYSLHGVGVCCDDFELVLRAPSDPWFQYLLANPANIPTHGLPLLWIGYAHFFLYDALKFAWVALAYAMAYRFGSLFFPAPRAALFAALFVVYPAHDSTSFWFTAQYLLLTASFYLYAFYLASRARLAAAAAMATLGSFVSYGSTPWALGLSLVFVLQREFRRAAVLLVPNLVYIVYYAAVTLWLGLGNKRLPHEIHVEALLKQLILQIAGGADAVLGPSLWLKIWYSVNSLTLLSAAVGMAIVLALLQGARAPAEPPRVRLALWLGAGAVVLVAFLMFAVAPGIYPQLAFGMVNRVVIYASFGAALVLAYAARRAWSAGALAALLTFSSLGLSDHWRAWRAVQDGTIEALRRDASLASGKLDTATLFVTGNAYSRLGAMAHIDFLSQRVIADPVFRIALGERKTFLVVPLRSRFVVVPNALVDPQDGARYPIAASVPVYDTEARELRRVDVADMPRLIAGLETPNRHWVQMMPGAWLRDFILRWMPQFGYLRR
jgi:hypothetical protein